jgi:hypothetical protein
MAGDQESWLSDYPPSDANQSSLAPVDFAMIPMLVPK